MFLKNFLLAMSITASAYATEFNFENYGIKDQEYYSYGPTRIRGYFFVVQKIENSFSFGIRLSHLSDDLKWNDIGYISAQVIAGDCPSRLSDGIYEKFGNHIHISKFKIDEPYQNRGYGTQA